MKQGGPHPLPLDQHAIRWDFQGQMAARKQALGWERKVWVPATAEGRGHALAPGSDGAWNRLKEPRQRKGKPWLNRTRPCIMIFPNQPYQYLGVYATTPRLCIQAFPALGLHSFN